jgi:hypothetical protein
MQNIFLKKSYIVKIILSVLRPEKSWVLILIPGDTFTIIWWAAFLPVDLSCSIGCIIKIKTLHIVRTKQVGKSKWNLFSLILCSYWLFGSKRKSYILRNWSIYLKLFNLFDRRPLLDPHPPQPLVRPQYWTSSPL